MDAHSLHFNINIIKIENLPTAINLIKKANTRPVNINYIVCSDL